MSADYWLGVATTPTLLALICAALIAYWRATAWLERRHGISFEAKVKRRVDEISDYTLRNNIWWERSFGPIFAGGWYRDLGGAKFTRWIGLGSTHGPCVMVFRKRDDA